MTLQKEYFCPICGSSLTVTEDAFECTAPDCDFQIPRELYGLSVTPQLLEKLLSGEKTKMYELIGKEGKLIFARLYLENGKVRCNFSSGIACPVCGKSNITINNGGAFCDCGFKVWRNQYHYRLMNDEMSQLLTEGHTGMIETLSDRYGGIASGILYFDDEYHVRVQYANQM